MKAEITLVKLTKVGNKVLVNKDADKIFGKSRMIEVENEDKRQPEHTWNLRPVVFVSIFIISIIWTCLIIRGIEYLFFA